MSVSPLAGFELVTLLFEVGDDTPTLDETGNLSADKTTLEVKAYLTKANRQMVGQSKPGETLEQVYLTGRFVEPIRRPPELVSGAKARATLNGQSGIFTLALSTATGVEALVAQQMGDPIEGVFEVRVNRGNFR
jgi:hypothetical protein